MIIVFMFYYSSDVMCVFVPLGAPKDVKKLHAIAVKVLGRLYFLCVVFKNLYQPI